MTVNPSPMSILALNVQAGGGPRVPALTKFLDDHDPQIVVLSEWRDNPSGRNLRAWADARKMHHAGQNDGGTANGVFLAANAPFTQEAVTPKGGGAGVLMLTHFDSFSILACYFPGMKEKAPFFARCAEIAASHTSRPFVILGDLNTGNQVGDRSEKADRYLCAEDFGALTTHHGLHDLWRRTHGPEAREWTWMSRTNNGFRIDHAFANDAFVQHANPSCVYDHRPRENRWTDHSALIVRSGRES